MAERSELENELAEMLVDVLFLEDVDPKSIEPEQPLFGEGLGLDSIDALEIAMAVAKKFKVELSAENEKNREIFASVRSLANYIEANLQDES